MSLVLLGYCLMQGRGLILCYLAYFFCRVKIFESYGCSSMPYLREVWVRECAFVGCPPGARSRAPASQFQRRREARCVALRRETWRASGSIVCASP